MNPKDNLAYFETQERFCLFKMLNQFNTVQDMSFTSGRVCYDVEIILKNGYKAIAEAKCRSFSKDKYDEYFLQTDKLLSLAKMAKKRGSQYIYYVNFFITENPEIMSFIIFDLTPRIEEWKINPPEVKQIWMNAITYLSDTKVSKNVILLKFDPRMDRMGTFNMN